MCRKVCRKIFRRSTLPFRCRGSLVQCGTHDLQPGMLILHRCLHVLVPHAVHDGRQVSGLLQNPRAVIVPPTIQDQRARKSTAPRPSHRVTSPERVSQRVKLLFRQIIDPRLVFVHRQLQLRHCRPHRSQSLIRADATADHKVIGKVHDVRFPTLLVPEFLPSQTKRRMCRLLSIGLIGAACGVPRPSSRLRGLRCVFPHSSVSSTGASRHILIRCSIARSTTL